MIDHHEFDALIDAWLAGRATDDEAARLGAIVESDPAARDHLLVLADLHACLATDERLWAAKPEPARVALPRRRTPFALAFSIGVLFGVASFGLTLVFARSEPTPSAGPVPLVDGDFESNTMPTTEGLPNRVGVWGGDISHITTGPNHGVTPLHGEWMFQFLRSDFEGERFTRSATGEVFQVIDLRGWSRPSGPVNVEVAGRVNSVRIARGEDYRWVAHAFAFETDPTARPREPDHSWLYRECLTSAHRRDVPDDGDPASWQKVSVELLIPPTANYLVVSFGVVRVRPAPTADPVRFPGHFLDMVEVVPLTTTPNRRR